MINWLRRLWATIESTVSPRYFYQISGRWLPWFAWPAALLIATGLVWGLAIAPADYQQGNSYRIIFIHVPAASLAMGGYLLLAICGAITLIWRVKTAEMVAKAAAPVGARPLSPAQPVSPDLRDDVVPATRCWSCANAHSRASAIVVHSL